MKYLCLQCDKTFDGEDSDKPRCPACLRTNSIEPVKTETKAATPKYFGLLAGLAAAVVVAGGYAYWSSRAPSVVEGDAPLRPLSEGELLGYLATKNAAFKGAPDLFRADDAVEDFAKAAVGSAGTPAAKAEAVVAKVRAHADKGAFGPWSLSVMRDADVLMPKDVLALLTKDGGHARLYPLEVALFTVAALRSEEVDAMLAEIPSFPNEKAPPDPTGRFGYYGVAVYPGKVGEGTAQVYDPAGGHAPMSSEGVRVLSDVQGTAAYMSHHATHALLADGKAQEAYAVAAASVALDGRSPVLRAAQASILAYVGGTEEATKEYQTALSLRSDGPRRMFQVQLAVAQGDLDGALKATQEVLAAAPQYAGAHAMAAQIYLAKQDLPSALAELNLAQAADPDVSTLPMLWANYYAASGQMDRAADFAEKAASAARHNWHTRMKAAWIFHAANRYDAMRREAKLAMADVPEADKAKMKEMLLSMLGPTVFDEEPTADDTTAATTAGDDAPSLNPSVATSGEPSPFQLSDPSESTGQGKAMLGGRMLGGTPLTGGPAPKGPRLSAGK